MAAQLNISYGFHPTVFGDCFIALTEKGLCNLSFVNKTDRSRFLEDFRRSRNNFYIKQNRKTTQDLIKKIFIFPRSKKISIPLDYQGTPFQMKVWKALLNIPAGKLTNYQSIARIIGHPNAVRAVGNAVGKNPIAYLIPCHRVIRSCGDLGGYRWGLKRKQAILKMEAARFNEGL